MYCAYKERLSLTPAQAEWCTAHAHMKRAVYNQCLAYNLDVYKRTGQFVFNRELKAKLVQLKQRPDFAWLKYYDSTAVQQAAEDFNTALKNFLESKSGDRKGRRINFPKFKKRGRCKESFRLINNASIRINYDTGTIRLPKIGELKICSGIKRLARIPTIGCKIPFVTISKDTDNHWYISITAKFRNPKFHPLKIKDYSSTGETCGIDMGVKDFITVGDANIRKFKKINLPDKIYRLEKLLTKYQRDYSRKYRAAKKRGADLNTAVNLNAARTKLCKIHYRIRKLREDFQHKLTLELTRQFDVITVETLNIQGMHTSLRAKHSRDIARQAWYAFIMKLDYKMYHASKILLKVNQYFPSSRLCSHCKYQYASLGNKRTWTCPSCGTLHDRDSNASFNLDKVSKYFLKTGQALLTRNQFLQVS